MPAPMSIWGSGAEGRALESGRPGTYLAVMSDDRTKAMAEFKRIMLWIVGIAVVMVILALTYLYATGELSTNLVIATTLGVFFSMVLGAGLFAAAFFSDKSGHDDSVSNATRGDREL